ncbi:MAG: aspartyl-phosphate phosphatase Spo0E family protein [Paenibacillaceae bacterium]|uniref:Aspartyl-phosphate phosphatase Spo0E family protein n=1 Tax=Paenibacillus mellifer TaxID=2937794 RepID=A0A9X2BR35_9BACL|nr:aspartyl-phosphate phosphatase Spo0E family protein [Paenibacillus mellifer]MBW4838453.1 aspartyl-phosphate phosphatase Spo0E family protein [Paenibacillaceae bacterium]MCK8488988.1 aspartyl-phosphate phosphatase Spo0E family protein [Paenibacillus mellifer]
MVPQTLRGASRNNNKISNDLKATIEHLRLELMNAATQDNFSSGTILELSQRLDQYIVMAQSQMLGK